METTATESVVSSRKHAHWFNVRQQTYATCLGSPSARVSFSRFQLDNDIAVLPPTPAALEQVVELSILLSGEVYSDDLEDPASVHYQTLSRQLAEKVSVWLGPTRFTTPRSLAASDRYVSRFTACDGCVVSFNNAHFNTRGGSESKGFTRLVCFFFLQRATFWKVRFIMCPGNRNNL